MRSIDAVWVSFWACGIVIERPCLPNYSPQEEGRAIKTNFHMARLSSFNISVPFPALVKVIAMVAFDLY